MNGLIPLHLNVQTNSNLSFSFLKINELVAWAKEQKLNSLAVADYNFYEVLDFLQLCREAKIKPIWGIKIFLKDEEKKSSLTIFPQNSKGCKEAIRILFAPNSPEDRCFTWEELTPLRTDSLIVFEAHNLNEINYFAN